MSLPLIVGAYAALPADRAGQEVFYSELAALGVNGIEIPFNGVLHDDPHWFAGVLDKRFGASIVTAIPGTMQRVGRDLYFGLASPDADGRQEALTFTKDLLQAIDDHHERLGYQVIQGVQLHSAPSIHASPDAFAQSLTQLMDCFTALNLRIYVEHCDAYSDEFPGEKRFLTLDDELDVAGKVGDVKVTVNWGRSAVENQDPETPRMHIARAAEAGLLGGIMMSGAGPGATQYGPAWGDAHLPLAVDEPTSLLTGQRVRDSVAAGRGTEEYRGVKIQVPSGTTVVERISCLTSVIDCVRPSVQ